MCRLLETIRVENRRIQNLKYHQARLDASSRLLFGANDGIDLKTQLKIPDFVEEGIFKCRVIYDRKICGINFEAYRPKAIHSLKLVYDDAIEYDYKYADRSTLNRLYAQRGSCDDILIVKQGSITDTSFCNILLFDGRHWFTPNPPLLAGTQRQSLIDKRAIQPRPIKETDLAGFSHFMLINAMLGFDERRAREVARIEG